MKYYISPVNHHQFEGNNSITPFTFTVGRYADTDDEVFGAESGYWFASPSETNPANPITDFSGISVSSGGSYSHTRQLNF